MVSSVLVVVTLHNRNSYFSTKEEKLNKHDQQEEAVFISDLLLNKAGELIDEVDGDLKVLIKVKNVCFDCYNQAEISLLEDQTGVIGNRVMKAYFSEHTAAHEPLFHVGIVAV